MKYTILPPQATPKQVTAHYSAQSLGDHFQSFMSVNNIRGFMEDLCVEEPIVEEVAAMWLIVVWEMQYQRQVEAMRLYGIQQLAERREARIKARAERIKPMQAAPVLKTGQVNQSVLVRGKSNDVDSQIFCKPLTPLQQYEQSVKSGRKYDVAEPEPFRDVEYRARRAAILAQAEVLLDKEVLNDSVNASPLRKHIVASRTFHSIRAVTPEQMKALAELHQQYIDETFVPTINIDEFLSNKPKSDPTSRSRINPYKN